MTPGDAKEEWFEDDPRFLKRIAEARANLAAGKGIPWEEVESEEDRAVREAKFCPKDRT